MNIKYWLNSERVVAGMTFADDTAPERNNMALHVCREESDVRENRTKLSEQLGCNLMDFVCTNQTHGTNIHHVVAADRGRGAATADTAIPETDALYTYEPGLLLCCFTADCVPVILYHETSGFAGTIHSGWQGTVKEITPKFLNRIQTREKLLPEELTVFLGAALGAARFEVDEDVSRQYSRLGYLDDLITYRSESGKYHIDNQMAVRRQCELAGIRPDRIFMDRTCTYDGEDCFSYRRNKECGRHMSFIMRRA